MPVPLPDTVGVNVSVGGVDPLGAGPLGSELPGAVPLGDEPPGAGPLGAALSVSAEPVGAGPDGADPAGAPGPPSTNSAGSGGGAENLATQYLNSYAYVGFKRPEIVEAGRNLPYNGYELISEQAQANASSSHW